MTSLQGLRSQLKEFEKAGTALKNASNLLYEASTYFTEFRGNDKGMMNKASELAKETNKLRAKNFEKQEKLTKEIRKLEEKNGH